MSRQLRREDYTVGWVCALEVELAAAMAMLDETHEDAERNTDDETVFVTGSIARHNVVIVCLPAGRIGSSPVAAVATEMRSKFKKIRFGLMVGVGGGVPSAEADIRLGDVVVSQPDGTFGGVVQYDMGKRTANGLERTGSLNSPPSILLSALSTMKAKRHLGRSTLCIQGSMLESNPKFQRSKAGPDILFQADYSHQGGPTCENCAVGRQEIRPQRESNEKIAVHYGTIASGNQVMKTAAERDGISAMLGGVLCFEMEAAGLMNSFKCLVIRGICDYADSHKNKQWQAYAAGTAASYAKELLSTIPAAEVAEQETMPNAIDALADPIHLEQSDLKAALADLARRRPDRLRWQQSAVDLLELLDLNSDQDFREWLAKSLHVRVGLSGSAKRNNALHQAIMAEIAAGELDWKELTEIRSRQLRCLNCGGKHPERSCEADCGLYGTRHTASYCRYPVRYMQCRKIGHMSQDCRSMEQF